MGGGWPVGVLNLSGDTAHNGPPKRVNYYPKKRANSYKKASLVLERVWLPALPWKLDSHPPL
jgi:hypothetical protein